MEQTFLDWQGTGAPVEASRGGADVWAKEAYRSREGPSYGKNYGADRYIGAV